ncbi:MAG: hypothetical protein KBT31_03180 [Firmicutes bacterium]|nr:hypothetical protein [Candidatus Colimorpha enterica]
MTDAKNTNENTVKLKEKDLEKVSGGGILGDYTKYECTNPSCFWSDTVDGQPVEGQICPLCGAPVKATYTDTTGKVVDWDNPIYKPGDNPYHS